MSSKPSSSPKKKLGNIIALQDSWLKRYQNLKNIMDRLAPFFTLVTFGSGLKGGASKAFDGNSY
jgi:hypothetical protein